LKKTLPSTLLLITAALMWLTLDPGDPVLELATTENNKRLQTYLDDSDYWSYDAQGVRTTRLETLHARRYSDDPAIYLDTIRMKGGDKQGRRWQLSAGSGELIPSSNQLNLADNVELKQADGHSKLTTDYLSVDTQAQLATTDAAVTLIHESSITKARGLRIDLPAGTAELLGDVETIYEARP